MVGVVKRRPRQYFQRAIDDAAKRIVRDIEQQKPPLIVAPPLSASMNPEVVVPPWRHPLFQGDQISYANVEHEVARMLAIDPPCPHSGAVPVESVLGEVVAWLCPECDEQLPAEWRSA